MQVNIKKVENGYIVRYSDKMEIVISDDVNNKDNIEYFKTSDSAQIALGKMLYEIADYFGNIYQKYQKNNLNITFDKIGHKLED